MDGYKEMAKSHIQALMDRISELYDKYPRIIFPDGIWNSLLALQESISDNSILQECRRIKGDYPYLYPLQKPQQPPKPSLRTIPTKHQIPYKKLSVEWYKLFDWLALLYSIIFAFIPCWVVIFLLYWMGFDIENCSWLYILACILVIIAFYIHYYNNFNDKPRIKTYYKDIPYSEDELIILKQKEQERYEQALSRYPSQLNEYKKLLKEYESDIKKQEGTVSQTIPQIVANSVSSSFHSSDSYSVVDDAPKRGRSENLLFVSLMSTIPSSVHVDTIVSGYYPDLMISTSNNVYIDVEIDEPYDMDTKKEIHYMGCDDDVRNERICDKDWIVVRFSERQVISNRDVCARILQYLIKFVETGYIQYLNEILNERYSIQEKRWTKEEARLMAINNYRNTY